MNKTENKIFDTGGNPDAKRQGTRVRKFLFEVFGLILLFLFSFYLMFRTFGYDSEKQVIKIAPKLWSDFGAHIPMIRSFSMGPNLHRLFTFVPIESPLFPGEPIRYHFGFYAIVGLLEKIGLRIDWALNLPSALGFFLLLATIYLFSWKLFRSVWASVLSVFFFVANGTLSFLTFFQKNPLNWQSISDITRADRFATFGPWDGQLITAFWSLNIYTNQRHLALSYGLVFTILLLVITQKKWTSGILIGLLAALLFFINFAAASILGLFLMWFFLVKKESRSPLLVSLTFVIPAFFLLNRYTNLTSSIMYDPGYLAPHPLAWQSTLTFWIYNLGLHSVLIPIGLLLAPRLIKKLFIVPIFLLFLLPNLFRFSPDMINNHKFFNFFIIIGGMFSAYALAKFWRIQFIGKIMTSILIFFLLLSGIIDFFPIINDHEGGLVDYTANEDAQYFLKNTPPDAVIANSYWFYHPAQMVGRAVYSGYTYFTFSYGYDQGGREKKLIDIYRANSLDEACALLDQNDIAYIELAQNPEGYLQPHTALWQLLTPDYENPISHSKVFTTKTICHDPQ